MKVGDILILSGKTKHGKNRVREQGTLWKVVRFAPALRGTKWPPGTEIVEIETVDGQHWRLIATAGDTDFDFHPQ